MQSAQMKPEQKEQIAKMYGILPEEVNWYNSGICYDRITVTSKDAADKVSESVKGETVNGGQFHGMPLGSQYKRPDGMYEIYC